MIMGNYLVTSCCFKIPFLMISSSSSLLTADLEAITGKGRFNYRRKLARENLIYSKFKFLWNNLSHIYINTRHCKIRLNIRPVRNKLLTLSTTSRSTWHCVFLRSFSRSKVPPTCPMANHLPTQGWRHFLTLRGGQNSRNPMISKACFPGHDHYISTVQ